MLVVFFQGSKGEKGLKGESGDLVRVPTFHVFEILAREKCKKIRFLQCHMHSSESHQKDCFRGVFTLGSLIVLLHLVWNKKYNYTFSRGSFSVHTGMFTLKQNVNKRLIRIRSKPDWTAQALRRLWSMLRSYIN